MGKAKDISDGKRCEIVALVKHTNHSMREIGRISDVSDRTVRRIAISLGKKNENNDNHRGNCGRKRKTSDRMDRKIVKEAVKNRRATSLEIQKAITSAGQTISISTIRRRLYESGLKCRRPAKRPFLTTRMHSKRLTWANEHKCFTVDQWEKVSNIFLLSIQT